MPCLHWGGYSCPQPQSFMKHFSGSPPGGGGGERRETWAAPLSLTALLPSGPLPLPPAHGLGLPLAHLMPNPMYTCTPTRPHLPCCWLLLLKHGSNLRLFPAHSQVWKVLGISGEYLQATDGEGTEIRPSTGLLGYSDRQCLSIVSTGHSLSCQRPLGNL